jgi:hypothetical protein
MFQLLVKPLLIIVMTVFALLVVRIRYQLCEKLVAVFVPFVWVGIAVLKWVWREPKRYKQVRGEMTL